MDVWYAAYGANTDSARLARYLLRCRDRAAPVASRGVVLGGALYFATESPVWGGGRGFYDPDASGRVLARAHLVTAGQFSDIAALEMYREPDADLDLSGALAAGRAELGPGRYETVVRAGDVDGVPLLTFTAPWAMDDVELLAPAEAYLRCIGGGLRAAGRWGAAEVAGYLARCPGVLGQRGAAEVLALIGDSNTTRSGEPG
ncbi:histone deacetylase [Streptomyces sp. NPDC056069]|uniref:histone deacetylase n=1 Tax=Streptomyces sp. NPDC056069 TaxID=3345702 RepID=UPI0035E1C6E4